MKRVIPIFHTEFDALQVSVKYPSYFLLSIFSPFMVSGEVQNDGQFKTLTISTKWTWINFTLSIIGAVSGFMAYRITVSGQNDITYFVVSFLVTFVPAAICLALLFCSERLCPSCCKVNLPILYKTGVDIHDFSKIINLQTGQEYGTKEDKEIEAAHQLVPIASSVCESGPILEQLEQQQMQINALNLQVETLTTHVSELREKLLCTK